MDYKKIAKILNDRLKRVNSDYLNYSSVSPEELSIRESEISAVAYEFSEALSWESGFDYEDFMNRCGLGRNPTNDD